MDMHMHSLMQALPISLLNAAAWAERLWMGLAAARQPPTYKLRLRAQVHCLKELRTLEASGVTPAKFKDYVPENLEVRALLSRDKNMRDDLYKAAVADTLIITMKVQFCHVYVLLRQVVAATSYRCGHRTPGIDHSHCSI